MRDMADWIIEQEEAAEAEEARYDRRFADNDIAQSMARARKKQERKKIDDYHENEDEHAKRIALFQRMEEVETSIKVTTESNLRYVRGIIQNPGKRTDEEIKEWKQHCDYICKNWIPEGNKQTFIGLCREIASLIENS